MGFSEKAKLTALAIVHIFETSKPFGDYGAVAVLNDGAGVSYGINQFTHKSGSLLKVVNTYLGMGGQTGANALRAALPLLQQASATAIHSLANNNIFKDALRFAAGTDEMRLAQNQIAENFYLTPAIEACEGSDFILPLSLAVIFDSINHGSFPRIRDAIRHSDADERGWITAYVRYRHAWLTSVPRLKVTAYRTAFFLEQIGKENWELHLPVNVHGHRLTDAEVQVPETAEAVTLNKDSAVETPAVSQPENLESIEAAEISAIKPAKEEAQPPINKMGESGGEQPVELRKERPSIFMKAVAGFSVVTGFLSSVGIGLQTAFDRIAQEITGKQIMGIMIGAGIGALGLWFYDRSAQRSNLLNEQKIEKAADTKANTVELT